MTQKKQVKKQPAPQALKDDALDRAAGGGNIEMAAWHELVILGDTAAAKKPGRTTFANIVLERG